MQPLTTSSNYSGLQKNESVTRMKQMSQRGLLPGLLRKTLGTFIVPADLCSTAEESKEKSIARSKEDEDPERTLHYQMPLCRTSTITKATAKERAIEFAPSLEKFQMNASLSLDDDQIFLIPAVKVEQ